MTLQHIALIGFGEAGTILGADLVKQGCRVQTYDRLLAAESSRPAMQLKAERHGVATAPNLASAIANAHVVISAVTAGSALAVARQAADAMAPDQIYLDINSVAPATKVAASSAVEAVRAHYVDTAVMAPVPPRRLQTPMLLGGQYAASLSPQLNALGFATRAVSAEVGVASAIKMCRSVMIKGLEALAWECLATARHYQAETEVLASLHQSFPEMGWDAALPHYLISRIAEHGRRRAEEMDEVAETVGDAGLPPHMSEAIAATQRSVIQAMAARDVTFAGFEPFDWTALRDLLANTAPQRGPRRAPQL